jgi:hypothetical protein
MKNSFILHFLFSFVAERMIKKPFNCNILV